MKVSVCIATYNGEKYIEEQIKSILLQLSSEDEIIVSDDNSSDNTIKILKKLRDKRIKIYFNSRKKGYTPNFENALEKARGDIILLSDQDDIWLPQKLERFKEKLKDFDVVISDAKIVNEKLEIIEKSLFKIVNIKTGLFNNLKKNRYYGCCIGFKKEILERVLPFPKWYSICPHDSWIPIVAEMYYKVGLIEEPLLLYRRHNSNVSLLGKSTNNIFKKIMVRAYPFINALMRRKKL